jgi:thiopeptide-type bacteriocin biosynthesis protein
LREAIGLPRWVLLSDHDNLLPCDLENVVSVEALAQTLRKTGARRLMELYPSAAEMAARGSAGVFMHELNIPFVRSGSTHTASSRGVYRETKESVRIGLIFPPGSEWLYLRLYCAPLLADRLLVERLAPAIHETVSAGCSDRWFFIRYFDPRPHLRLRFHGDPARLTSTVLGTIRRSLEAATEGASCELEVATYQREMERYGGPELMEVSEILFFADSEAVLSALSESRDIDARWQFAVLGVDRLLNDFGLRIHRKLWFAKRRRDELEPSLMSEYPDVRRAMARSFRSERDSLSKLLDGTAFGAVGPMGVRALERRSLSIREAVSQIRTECRQRKSSAGFYELLGSHLHMHLNRVMPSSQRLYEFMVFDFLSMLYRSRVARAQEVVGPDADGQLRELRDPTRVKQRAR